MSNLYNTSGSRQTVVISHFSEQFKNSGTAFSCIFENVYNLLLSNVQVTLPLIHSIDVLNVYASLLWASHENSASYYTILINFLSKVDKHLLLHSNDLPIAYQ